MGSGILVLNQPGVYFVDADGNTITLGDGAALGSAEALVVAGKNGSVAQFLGVDATGKMAVQNPPNLDAALSTLATETKLETVRALLATIDADTSNLDVALSTRASEATVATLATETKLEAVRVLLASIDSKDFATQTTLDALLTAFNAEDFATQVTLAALLSAFNAEDFASETTLASADAKLATIDSVLDSIKDTDGVKKITDPLPAGTNEIGKVAQGTKGSGANAWPGVLYDAAGNVITSITDIEDPAEKRLQTEARLAPGSIVNIGTGVPADPGDLVVSFLTDSGGDHNMLVDGSVTPVAFTFEPPTGVTISVQEILVIFTADDFAFDGASFGPNTALANGIKVETTLDGTTTEIFNIIQNEDYLRIPGRIPLVNNTGPKDVLGVAFQFGGLLKLVQADGDNITITVRDDLTSVKLKYLTATVFGATI